MSRNAQAMRRLQRERASVYAALSSKGVALITDARTMGLITPHGELTEFGKANGAQVYWREPADGSPGHPIVAWDPALATTAAVQQ